MASDRPTPADIVNFRDGAVTTKAFRRNLAKDDKGLLALAESRILALALALHDHAEPGKPWSLPDAEKLVAYLHNTLPVKDRHLLEQEMRGNPRALEFLVALCAAVYGKDAPELQVPASMPASSPRIDLGAVTYRERGDLLEFRRDDIAPEIISGVSFDDLDPSAEASFVEERRKPHLRLEEESSSFFFDSEQREFLRRRLAQLQEIAMRLAEALESVRGTIDRLDSAASIRYEDLTSVPEIDLVLSELEGKIVRLQDELMTARKLGAFRQREPRAPLAALRLRQRSFAEFAYARPMPPRQLWHGSLSLAYGDTSITLSGTSTPAPALELAISSSEAATMLKAEVTIVQPGRDFSSAIADASGLCSLALPKGDLLVLVDTDRTFRFHLNLARR